MFEFNRTQVYKIALDALEFQLGTIEWATQRKAENYCHRKCSEPDNLEALRNFEGLQAALLKDIEDGDRKIRGIKDAISFFKDAI